MKICLVFPGSTFLEDPMVFPPLGLWYLMSVLQEAGHEAKFIDMSENNISVEDLPCGFDAYLVSGTSPQAQEIRKIGKELQRRHLPAVLGGPHATNYPRNSRKYFPLIVKREGERAVLKALELIERGLIPECLTDGDIDKIKNNDKGALSKYAKGIVEEPFIQDLGSIPVPDRSYALKYNYYLNDEHGNMRRGTSMFTSRGCPKRCDFCDSPNLWSRRVRYTPMNRLLEEFEQIRALGFRAIQFYDDILPINPKRIKEICRHLKFFDFIWRCFCRVDIISQHGGIDYLKFMYDHGLREVLVGAESGSQKILDNIHKGTTVEQNANVLEWCDEVGIRCKLSFIIGLPGETRETLLETKNFLRDHLIMRNRKTRHKVDLCSFIPMSGTPIYKTIARRMGDPSELEEDFDTYGYDLEELDEMDFDMKWDVDAALLDSFFYDSELIDGKLSPDEVFYKGKKGTVRQIVSTSSLSREDLEAARNEMEEMVREAGITY